MGPPGGQKRGRKDSPTSAEEDGEALENLRLATSEVSELCDAPTLLRAEHFQRLGEAVFALPISQRSPSHSDSVVSSLRAARRAFQASTEVARAALLGDYVSMLGAALRQGFLLPRGATEVLSWLREALDCGDDAATLFRRLAAAEDERSRLLGLLAQFGDVQSAAAVLSSISPPSSRPRSLEAERPSRSRRRKEQEKAAKKAQKKPTKAKVPSSSSSEKALPEPSLELAPPLTPSASSTDKADDSGAIVGEAGAAASNLSRAERLDRLTRRLMSPAVQLPVPGEAQEEPARLTQDEVGAVFERHVPGVKQLTYRGQDGVHSLKFMQSCYVEGLRAFNGADLHNHLLWLFRLIVHQGHDDKPGASRHLREVAEAFTDCQAVQARTIEKVGLQLRGLALDFKGQMVRLVGEYKDMAVKMLAYEECTKLGGPDEYNDPPHYENRVIVDLGDICGLNKANIRQAEADSHAHSRFRPYKPESKRTAALRLAELFDLEALLKAFAAEASTFGSQSCQESLPRLFLEWANERMTQKHIVFDEDTCTRVEVDGDLALAISEVVFLGRPNGSDSESYRGERLLSLFHHDEELVAEIARQAAGQEEAAKEEAAKEEAGKGKDKPVAAEAKMVLEVDLGSHWAKIDAADIMRKVSEVEAKGESEVCFRDRGFNYKIDLQQMVQINLETGKRREIRRREEAGGKDEEESEDEDEDEE
ncbi:unnamed protein product [Polarella glacialis]|uniref:WWE domain-containing protein n=1 Tax=Polarella glacialis TaxID=89957 RepID=A0A813H3D6_POLGL|nr:unnamed protein product [Polarella glacialis]